MTKKEMEEILRDFVEDEMRKGKSIETIIEEIDQRQEEFCTKHGLNAPKNRHMIN